MPDRNFICPKFIGRKSIIEDLWFWLGDDFLTAKALAGDGGKGKTSIAYEFAEEVCRIKPYDIEKVIWLTAKKRQFKAIYNDYIGMPETHFDDLESLLKVLCSELAILPEEIEGASVMMLKKILKNALSKISCLIIIDDVDSTEQNQQKMILETALNLSPSTKSRLLVTTRMNLMYSDEMCITVSGLQKDEYREYVKTLLNDFPGLKITTKKIDNLHITTDGSPLYTQSLFRLTKTGMTLNEAINKWKGKFGSEVRAAALKREVKQLSQESKRILLSCSYMNEASLNEIKQVTGYSDERMQVCLDELRSLFLLSAPKFVKNIPRFKVSNNTAILVIENKDWFVPDPKSLRKKILNLRTSRSIKKVGPYRVIGSAINQASALLRENEYEDAIKTVETALKDYKNIPDLLLMKGKCLLQNFESTKKKKTLDNARKFFSMSYEHGQRKNLLYRLWYKSEMDAKDASGAIDVAKAAIKDGVTPSFDWLNKKANSHILLSNIFKDDHNYSDALAEMRKAVRDINESISISPRIQRSYHIKLLADLNDEIWKISKDALSGFDGIRYRFDIAKEALNYGDIRSINLDHMHNSLNGVYIAFFNASKNENKINEKQFNLLDQMVRETKETLKLIKPFFSDLNLYSEYSVIFADEIRTIDNFFNKVTIED